MELPSILRYRFFFPSLRKMAHAKFPRWNTLRNGILPAPGYGKHLPSRLLAPAARRYALSAAPRPHGRMLLPLCGIQRSRRLRENVRLKTLCLSLVGGEMREASHAHASARLPRRPAVSASPPLRTRASLESVFNSQFLVFRFGFSRFASKAFDFCDSPSAFLSWFSHSFAFSKSVIQCWR